MTAYASVSDLIARRDKRLIGELIKDDDDPPTDAELLASTVLETLLEDASGQVEAAMLSGKRYEPEDLAGLTGHSLSFLKKIICTLVMADLYERRPGIHQEQAKQYMELARLYLEDLRSGKNLFNLSDSRNSNAANPDTTAPTTVDYYNLNLLPEQMVRHFPNRASRLPRDRAVGG
jgi:phage gp36-like protein